MVVDEEPPGDSGGLSERRVASLEELFHREAVIREHGGFLLLHNVGQVDGEDAFEGVPAKLASDPPSEIGWLHIGKAEYVMRWQDLESAIDQQGGDVRMGLYAGVVDGEDAYKIVTATLVAEGSRGFAELRIDDTPYLLILDDFEDAVTDPATYDPERHGPPYPIDVLRDPPGPE